MTPSTKPVTRITSPYVRDKGPRPVAATIVGGVLILRATGLRREETLDLASCYYRAVKERVTREALEKKRARKAK